MDVMWDPNGCEYVVVASVCMVLQDFDLFLVHQPMNKQHFLIPLQHDPMFHVNLDPPLQNVKKLQYDQMRQESNGYNMSIVVS